jgi:hypothetical protein
MSQPRVILLEFNELTPSLLDRFFATGKLPNFRHFHDQSFVYVTDAEEEADRLDPWIQWTTVHTGLSADEHGLRNLNEGHLLATPRVWDLASRAGMRAFVCGSMNVAYEDGFNGWVLPDPWSTTVEPYPEGEGLVDFYRFVQVQVQEHTNDHVPLSAADYARFLRFMVSHGLSPFTASSIVKQLAKERVGGEGRWKRAVLLDKLLFDVFRSMFKRHHPHFSTFFLNSTAHMQHVYWRHMDPEQFAIKPSPQERDTYGGAVEFGYEEMDKLLGRIMDLAGDDVTVVFATALGQQPCLTYEGDGGKRFHRPRAIEALVRFAGITAPHRCAPVMAEQFQVYFETEADADEGVRRLEGLRVDGRVAMEVRREGDRTVFAGCTIYREVRPDARLVAVDGDESPFHDLFYAADTVKSGMHHPEGALWIRTPSRAHRVREDRVPLRSVAPTLLRLLGLVPPDYMSAPSLDLPVPADLRT